MTTATTTKPQVTVIPKNDAPTQQVISNAAMVQMLMNRKGNMFIGLHTNTDADKGMNKTNCLKGDAKRKNPLIGLGIRKLAHSTYMVGFDFDSAVQRRSEGTDEAKKNGNTWQMAAVRQDGSRTPLSYHKDDANLLESERRWYIAGEYQNSKKEYADAEGKTVADADIAPWLKKRSSAEFVKWHTVSLNNIVKLTMDSVTYIVQD